MGRFSAGVTAPCVLSTHGVEERCPECLNPHTIVAEHVYRGVLRFCPMCDHSWVVGQVSREPGPAEDPPVREKGRHKADPGDEKDEN